VTYKIIVTSATVTRVLVTI